MRRAAIVTASILLVGWLIFQILGYAIIIDRTGRLISATIVASDGAKQGFNKLPGNLYFAIPAWKARLRFAAGTARMSRAATSRAMCIFGTS